MTIVYAIETYPQIISEIAPLLALNHKEIATYQDIPLEPNYEFYARAAAMGLIRIYSARSAGELIGYAVVIVQERHAHYRHPWATSNLIWIHPDFRRSGAGRGLIGFLQSDLVGFVLQIATSVDHPQLAALLESEGFAPVETVHSIRL